MGVTTRTRSSWYGGRVGGRKLHKKVMIYAKSLWGVDDRRHLTRVMRKKKKLGAEEKQEGVIKWSWWQEQRRPNLEGKEGSGPMKSVDQSQAFS